MNETSDGKRTYTINVVFGQLSPLTQVLRPSRSEALSAAGTA